MSDPFREFQTSASPVDPAVPAVEEVTSALELDEFDLHTASEFAARFDFGPVVERDGEAGLADWVGAAYKLDPSLTAGGMDAPGVSDRRRFLRQLLETADYASMHAETSLNRMKSAIAARHFADAFGEAQAREPHDHEGGKLRPGSPGYEAAKDRGYILAAYQATQASEKDIRDHEAACQCYGVDPGSDSEADVNRMAAVAVAMRGSGTLRRIIELAGRFRLASMSARRSRPHHGLDEIVGVETGADLARVLPTELGRIAHPSLRLDFMRRFAEKSMMQYELHAPQDECRGPIVVCIDESGSMSGDMLHSAKAIALVIAEVCRKEKRSFVVVEFATASQIRETRHVGGHITPDNAPWITHMFCGSGTDFDAPLTTAARTIRAERPDDKVFRRSDVVFITDGQAPVSAETREVVADIRRGGSRISSIVIGGGANDLRSVSDQYVECDALTPTSEATSTVLAAI